MNTRTADVGEPLPMAGREKRNVLIVDDDSSVRKSISRVLKDAGYEVSQARDEQEAMTQFDSKQIDLVLLDLGLPNRSGWDIFEGFTSRNPTLPIIIITGRASQFEIAMAAGVGALMEKPLDAAQLLQTMHDLLIETEEARLRRMCGYTRDVRYIPIVPRFIHADASAPARHKPK